MKRYATAIALLLLNVLVLPAQGILKGRVIDKETREPVPGASITIPHSTAGTSSDASGHFAIVLPENTDTVGVSCLGYQSRDYSLPPSGELTITLEKNLQVMNALIVTASRGVQLRKDAPVSIRPITAKMIHETKPVLLPEIINKVPGVLMTNLNNEQHSMSIRQPMTTAPYFLYLEDGIPMRPAGVFNHNALIETDLMAISSIEVVKGPASSLYGSEAIGGAINFITQKPSVDPYLKVGVQGNQYGYLRAQFGGSMYYSEQAGFYVGGLVARQRNGWQTYSDYDKTALSLRHDWQLTGKTSLVFAASYIKYNTQTSGSVDSAQFYDRSYVSNSSFTFRDVYALRARATLNHKWNDNGSITATLFFRDNAIGQLPSYSIKKDLTDPGRAHGQINENSFNSYGFVIQQTQKFSWLRSKLVAGVTLDYSPNSYWSDYVLIHRNPVTGFMASYTHRKDSMLTRYEARLLNSAVYAQWQFSPMEKMNVVVGARYDRIDFSYKNHLPPSAFSGAPDEKNGFNNVSPKVGATYEINRYAGIYVNYSRGFSPPTINQLYSGVKVPILKPAYFDNYEVGGWTVLFNNKLSVDWALYRMEGRNEIVSYRLPDNSREYRNSGATLHTGIEYGFTWRPDKQWTLRFGGTHALHRYEAYQVKQGEDYSGNRMPSSPSFIANAELGYRPAWLKGFRVQVEWQRIGKYYIDNENSAEYKERTLFGLRGVSVMNLRVGYEYRMIEVFANLLNLSNELYAHNASRSGFGTTYTPAAPRLLNMGVQVHLGKKEEK